MKLKGIDWKSFAIGALSVLLLFSLMGNTGMMFSPEEAARLKNFANRLRDNGDLDMGRAKIIMQGSSIYDDSSEGGGLIVKGGGGRLNLHGSLNFDGVLAPRRDTVALNANLDMGRSKIIMLGSSIYDDASEGGGLIVKGGGGRLNLFGSLNFDGVLVSKRDTIALNANLDMGRKKIIMQGSTIYDDSSEGGGLLIRGGGGRVQTFGDLLFDANLFSRQDKANLYANLDMGKKKILMQGSSIYDDSSEGGGLILRGGAGRIHLFGQTLPH